MLYICKFGVNTNNIHTIKQAYNIQTSKPIIEKEKIFDFFIHSYIHCRVLRYYRGLKLEDFFKSSVCRNNAFNTLKSRKLKMRHNYKMCGRTPAFKQNAADLKSDSEIQVSIQCLSPLLVYLLLRCLSGLGN